MAVDCAVHKTAAARDLIHGFAALEAPQRLKLAIVQSHTSLRSQTTVIVAKCPAFICRKIRSDFAEERLGELFQFLLADAGVAAELACVCRLLSRHFAAPHVA